jgi:hypothetical protein
VPEESCEVTVICWRPRAVQPAHLSAAGCLLPAAVPLRLLWFLSSATALQKVHTVSRVHFRNCSTDLLLSTHKLHFGPVKRSQLFYLIKRVERKRSWYSFRKCIFTELLNILSLFLLHKLKEAYERTSLSLCPSVCLPINNF